MSKCLNLKMPPAPKEERTRVSRNMVPDRPLFIAPAEHLCKREPSDRIQAFIALGHAMNSLGATLKLKEKYLMAAIALESQDVRFEIIPEEVEVSAGITH